MFSPPFMPCCLTRQIPRSAKVNEIVAKAVVVQYGNADRSRKDAGRPFKDAYH